MINEITQLQSILSSLTDNPGLTAKLPEEDQENLAYINAILEVISEALNDNYEFDDVKAVAAFKRVFVLRDTVTVNNDVLNKLVLRIDEAIDEAYEAAGLTD